MSAFLAKQKAFTFHAEIEYDQLLPGGPKMRLAGALDMGVSRPGSLHVDFRDDVMDRLIWFENGRVTIVDPVGNTYAQIAGPKDIDGMVAKLEKEYGVTLPLGEIAESDPYAGADPRRRKRLLRRRAQRRGHLLPPRRCSSARISRSRSSSKSARSRCRASSCSSI